jgi:hypothetical protein
MHLLRREADGSLKPQAGALQVHVSSGEEIQ